MIIYYKFKSIINHNNKYYKVKIIYIYNGANSYVNGKEIFVTLPIKFKNTLNFEEYENNENSEILGEMVESVPLFSLFDFKL